VLQTLAEGAADRQHPFADLQLVTVAQGRGRQSSLAHLEHRHVGARIGAFDLGLDLATVGEHHLDLIGAFDHMVVREDDPVGAYHHPRAQAAGAELLGLAGLAGVAEEATEPAPQLGRHILQRTVGIGHHPLAGDGHHRGGDPLGDIDEGGRKAPQNLGVGLRKVGGGFAIARQAQAATQNQASHQTGENQKATQNNFGVTHGILRPLALHLRGGPDNGCKNCASLNTYKGIP